METPDAGVSRETGTPEILCHVRERVATLTFNRPDAKNALTMDMKEALYVLVRALEEDPAVGCLVLTGAGVSQPGDRPKLLDHVIRRVLKLAQPDVLRDSTGHVEALRASGLDWTAVRAPMLTDGPAAPLRVGMVGDIGPRLSRASAAAFMLEHLGSDLYSRQAPAISN